MAPELLSRLEKGREGTLQQAWQAEFQALVPSPKPLGAGFLAAPALPAPSESAPLSLCRLPPVGIFHPLLHLQEVILRPNQTRNDQKGEHQWCEFFRVATAEAQADDLGMESQVVREAEPVAAV